jgi:hypothetical protein
MMPNPLFESEHNPQLSEILSQLSVLSERVTYLEDKLMLVADTHRYVKLQGFLREGNFKDADRETTNIILDISGCDSRDSLSPEDIQKFPCHALTVIDKLWVNYSQQRFGFSIQLGLYRGLGGSIETLRTQDTPILKSFAEKVGWYTDDKLQFDHYDNWDFSLAAPVGCFPAAWWKSPYGLKMVTYFFTRLIKCDL